MKRMTFSVVTILAAAFLLSSCLSDDTNDNYTLAGDAAATGFVLGTMTRQLHTTTDDGRDSVYKETYSGSAYRFHIDQIARLIYNTDSLPYATDATRGLATVTTKNGGFIFMKNLPDKDKKEDGSEEGTADDTYKYFSSTDTMDFSVPRTLRIASLDTKNYRDYTIEVRVHQEEGDEFKWSERATVEDFKQLREMRLVSAGEQLFLFGSDHVTTRLWSSDSEGRTWRASNATFGEEAWKNVVVKDGDVFVLDGSELKHFSQSAWTTKAADNRLKQLVAASSSELYALSDKGGLLMSCDDGDTWTEEMLDVDNDLLPTENFGYTCRPVKTNTDVERVLLVGTQPGDETVTCWTKLVGNGQTAAEWTYVDTNDRKTFVAPYLRGLTIFDYDGRDYLFGVLGTGYYSQFLYSQDAGIAWRTDTSFSPPGEFGTNEQFAATSDDDNFIWLVDRTTGKVWCGRVNRLGWDKQDTIFNE